MERDEFGNDGRDSRSLREVFGAKAPERGGIEDGAEEEQLVDAVRFLPVPAQEDCRDASDANQCKNGVRPNYVAGNDRRCKNRCGRIRKSAHKEFLVISFKVCPAKWSYTMRQNS